MGVTVVYQRSQGAPDFIIMQGTKVFLNSGEEIKGISQIGMPMKGAEGLLEVTVTLAVSDIVIK